MKTKTYTISIKAAVEKVYDIMLGLTDKKTYQAWVSIFNPTSTFEGSWEKGSEIRFIGTDQKGQTSGMLSKIVENKPNEFVSILHYGIIKNDQEITQGAAVEQWAGFTENYTFKHNNGLTKVTIEMNTHEDYIDYFDDSWPKALKKLKELAES